jgi:hypothetical protein
MTTLVTGGAARVHYFEDGSHFGFEMKYYIDDPKLPGSGGSLFNAFKKRSLQRR